MKLTFDQFNTKLSTLLRDLMPCTTADLTDTAIAYWDGRRVVYCYLDDDSGLIDEEFDLGGRSWDEWREYLTQWIEAPKFSMRPEVQDWLNDAPPDAAG
ncbi:hypothetical protein [Paraburkholderia sp. BCC1884]|uniref:hypothetical protein n=1 Tax=Paraburkholderia sp. BCC1884 TaxID=2562668 RepID=UPI0021B201A2|nr:hypothetical protein [Paraburkholderia sp. BCC1884]